MMRAEMEKAERHADAPTVRRALRQATASLSDAGIESARLDAELLLAEALGLDRSKLYLHDEAPLEARAEERFRALLARRVGGEPAAYITGRREFWSLDFLVTPAVLVPRPETEMLVEVAVGLLAAKSQISNLKFKILDLGTGSGAIAVSLAKEIGAAEIWATDISADALEVARLNARRHGFERKIHFLSGDVFEPVRDRVEFFDLIVSNPPYVRRAALNALPRDVRDFEPRVALDGGADGLEFYRRIIPGALGYLAMGGFLAVEIGTDIGADVARLFTDSGGYAPPQLYRDLAGKQRIVCARMKGFLSG
jgi:release factor glutamine methyltransferase